MATFEYKIASGYNIADGSMTYLETVFNPFQYGFPNVNRVPPGSVTRFAIDGTRRTDGAKLVDIRYAKLSFTDLGSYITAYLGSWTTESAQVTLKTRNIDGSFTRYNALAYLPIYNEDYEHRGTAIVINVRLPFRIVETAT